MTGRRKNQLAQAGSTDWLCEQYRGGRTQADLADELGVSHSAVSKRLRAAGVLGRSAAEVAAAARPAGLNDAVWLRARTATSSIKEIASELGVNEQRVLASMRRLSIPTRDRHESTRLRHPPLHDAVWLKRLVGESSVAEVAEELGVARASVAKAMKRLGVTSPHRFDSATRIERPSDELLVELWLAHGTVKAVALVCGVSPTTARVWLAAADCFVSDEPALTDRDLEAAIAAGHSLRIIGRSFRVTASTVLVELHRHGLFWQHRHRHLPVDARDEAT